MKNWTMNGVLAFFILIVTSVLFYTIVFKALGGNEALFLVIGYFGAWAQMIVIYYFRKKPSDSELPK